MDFEITSLMLIQTLSRYDSPRHPPEGRVGALLQVSDIPEPGHPLRVPRFLQPDFAGYDCGNKAETAEMPVSALFKIL